MAVICFASAKGGVGKTSASINTAHALAKRGCETLLIDLDPACHATRLLTGDVPVQSPLVLLLDAAQRGERRYSGNPLENAAAAGIELSTEARPCLAVTPAGPDLRLLLHGKNAERFLALFPRLLEELGTRFDYVVVDTPPDINILSQAAISASSLTVVPVDQSAMSIASLELLVDTAGQHSEPAWAVLRMMVNRSAARVRRLSQSALEQSLGIQCGVSGEAAEPAAAQESPIFLLESVIYRTEEQNRASYSNNTALDNPSSPLAAQYLELARELEQVLAQCEDRDDGTEVMSGFWEMLAERQ